MFRVLTVPNAFVPIIAPIAASVISKPGKFFLQSTCICEEGFEGPDCSVQSRITCPNNCSGNGVCDFTSGQCTCN